MGREVRMVPADWKHPKDESGKYIPLLKRSFSQADAEWSEGYAAWQRGEIENYGVSGAGHSKWKPKPESALDCANFTEWNGRRPSPDDYMPDFPNGTATMLMMYEDTSEGTPISPAFATPEELARWLADTGASAFGSSGATYEQWLATCRGAWAPSMVVDNGKVMSGVEFAAIPRPAAELSPPGGEK
jgi:hypothetical protein